LACEEDDQYLLFGRCIPSDPGCPPGYEPFDPQITVGDKKFDLICVRKEDLTTEDNPKEFYVSGDPSDTNGIGTKAQPFSEIIEAI